MPGLGPGRILERAHAPRLARAGPVTAAGSPVTCPSVGQQLSGAWWSVEMGRAAVVVEVGVRVATVLLPALSGDRGDQSPAVDRRQQRHLPGRVGDRAGAATQVR